MLITNHANMDKFEKAVENCKHGVFLILDEDMGRNLKQDSFFVKALSKTKVGPEGLEIRFEDRKDLMNFMNEMYDTYQE